MNTAKASEIAYKNLFLSDGNNPVIVIFVTFVSIYSSPDLEDI